MGPFFLSSGSPRVPRASLQDDLSGGFVRDSEAPSAPREHGAAEGRGCPPAQWWAGGGYTGPGLYQTPGHFLWVAPTIRLSPFFLWFDPMRPGLTIGQQEGCAAQGRGVSRGQRGPA